MDYLWITIWITGCLVVAILITLWVLDNINFKHKVRIIDLAQQNGLELDFKAKEINVDGVRYWRLNKEKNKEIRDMPMPPALSINIGKKGIKSVEAVRTETGEYIFLSRKINLNALPDFSNIPHQILNLQDENEKQKMIRIWKKKITEEWKVKNKGMILEGVSEPLTSKQRMILMHNFEKANARKGFNLKEAIPQMVAWAVIGLIIIALMVFWGDIAKPALTSKELTKDIVETQKEIVVLLNDIKGGSQRILPEGTTQ